MCIYLLMSDVILESKVSKLLWCTSTNFKITLSFGPPHVFPIEVVVSSVFSL